MLNVVVYHRLDEAQLRRLAAISPGVSVRVGLPAHRLAEARARVTAFPPANIMDLLPEADVLYAFRLPEGIRERARRLKWLQFAMAGVDQAIKAGLFGTGIVITTSSGIHAIPMGEYAMAAMLMFSHRFPEAARRQAAHVWQPHDSAELSGKTLGIVGYGHVGRHIAGLAQAFGMRVVASRRGQAAAACDELPGGRVDLLPAAGLHSLLQRSDYVVLTVPLAPGTERLIGAAELAAMKPTARLINIARGGVVDQQALTTALANGAIAGACLDVFEQEPLPADSPLWDMPNVIITSHCAGSHERYDERAAALFHDNLARYVAGQPLLNVVDEARGY